MTGFVDKYGDEQVLVLPTETFNRIGHFSGFNPNTEPYIRAIIDDSQVEFILRSKAETDENYKQIIPYVVLEHHIYTQGTQLLCYRRHQSGGEDRLHDMYSVGIGGHINPVDAESGQHFETGAFREIREEIDAGEDVRIGWHGLIHDTKDAVGRVHLGVVGIVKLQKGDVRPAESSIADMAFEPVVNLYRKFEQLEGWSQLALQHLYPLRDFLAPEDITGMPHAEATSLISQAGLQSRVVEVDGDPREVDAMMNPERFSLKLDNGKVKAVELS